MKRFGGIIVGLVIVAVLLIVIASFSEPSPEDDSNPSRTALADQRTTPVGAVRTELAAEPAATEPATAAAGPDAGSAAEPAAVDGSAVFASTCQACHLTGAAGAPIPGSAPWTERAAKGVDALVASAINGIGVMPPKGGFAHLSDAEVRAAVEHMLAQ